MLEIIMLIFGLVLLIRGKVYLGKGRHVEGAPVRVAGLIMMAPIPVVIASNLFMVILVRVVQSPINPQSLERGLFVLELVLVILCAVIAGRVLRAHSVLTPLPGKDEPILLSGTGKPGWHICPQCGQPGISSWKKLFYPGSCAVCNCPVMADPARNLVASLPGAAGLFLPIFAIPLLHVSGLINLESMTTAGYVALGALALTSIVVGAVISFILALKWVPLRRR